MIEKAEILKKITTTQRQLPTNKISNKYAGLKVAGLTADVGACGFYRVVNPLHMLLQNGAEVVYSSVQNFNDLMAADVIYAPRQNGAEMYDHLRRLQWENKHVIYELDDDLHNVLPSSPAISVYHKNSEALRSVEKFVSSMHGITVTTPELARMYSQFNTNYAIIENFIDFSLRDWGVDVSWNGIHPVFTPKPLTRPKEWEGKIVLTWAGGATHKTDLEDAFPFIRTILEKYPSTMFAYYGLWELFEEANIKGQIPLDRVFKIDPRHFLEYPEGLRGDIGLAPISPCQFNLCKSALKVEEYMAVGMAVVASNFGPYARFGKRHPNTLNLVGNGQFNSWAEAVGDLIENPDKLRMRQIQGRQLILDNYSLEHNYHLWPMAWEAIIKRAHAGQAGPPTQPLYGGKYVTFGSIERNDKCPCGSGLKYKNCCRGAFG